MRAFARRSATRRPPSRRRPELSRPLGRASANEGPLTWAPKGDRIRTADGHGGQYVVISDGLAFWTAQWHEHGKKRAKLLFLRTSETHARDVCAAHHRDQVTNALLVRHDSGDLVQRHLQGPAVAWK